MQKRQAYFKDDELEFLFYSIQRFIGFVFSHVNERIECPMYYYYAECNTSKELASFLKYIDFCRIYSRHAERKRFSLSIGDKMWPKPLWL